MYCINKYFFFISDKCRDKSSKESAKKHVHFEKFKSNVSAVRSTKNEKFESGNLLSLLFQINNLRQ